MHEPMMIDPKNEKNFFLFHIYGLNMSVSSFAVVFIFLACKPYVDWPTFSLVVVIYAKKKVVMWKSSRVARVIDYQQFIDSAAQKKYAAFDIIYVMSDETNTRQIESSIDASFWW